MRSDFSFKNMSRRIEPVKKTSLPAYIRNNDVDDWQQ